MATTARKCPRLALVVVGIILGFTDVAHTYEVVLLDTTRYGSLNWQTYKNPNTPSGLGWREASYTVPGAGGDVYRIYTVCNVASMQVNNWLRTPYIPRGHANRLYIDIKFTMRKCTKYPDPKKLVQCKESFKLLYYEAESDFANTMMPTWDADTYKALDVVAGDTVFENINEAIINTETRSLAIGRRGVYFAFYDEGACTTLISIKVYYILCPSTTLNFAVFPNTTTGPDQSSIVQKKGTCVNHAAIETQPTYLCKGDGTWTYMTGGCKCMPGYEPGPANKLCTPCPEGKYKWKTGSEACLNCPAHSHARNVGSVECRCEEGHYRSINDDKSAPCSKPPSEVLDLKVSYRDQSTVNLTWKLPMDIGGRRDLSYRLECIACDNSVHFRPKKSGFNSTKLSVTGLSPSTKYKFIIYAENGVSIQSGVTGMASIIVVTETAIPSKVNNLRILTVGTNYVTIAWDPPTGPHSRIERYEVKYYPKHKRSNASSVMTANQNATFTNLALNTKYSFTVRGKTVKGWGEFSTPIHATTGQIETIWNKVNKVNTQIENNQMGIIAGSAVAVLVCMIIVIIMVVIFLRRNHRACNEKNVSDCDTLQYSNVQCPPVLDHLYTCNGGLTVPLFQAPGAYRSYIDPHTYEDPNQAVREFTKEIDASCIMIESVIGGGEFGDVCKGRLRVPGKGDLTVAIKTLKAGASDKNRLDFLTEASIMGQFEDPNVIYLEGVVTKSQPIMIVTEYMANGSLDTFLRNNDGKLTVLQLVGMMRGIASGQRYLSDMGYVHRDLAARNILVNENLVCKVADFGLSREIEVDTTEGAYTTKGGKIPVRWTAPEAIAYRKFTSASDVWSFGIVMWEVMSFGERPYWNWSNQDVIKAVDKGYRLPPPMDCAEAIHQLMLDCWQKERSHRPKFTAIVKTLDKLIRAPELLRKIAKARPYQYFDSDTPNMMSYTSIEEWLTSIKMDRYTQNFLQEGYTNMEQVSQITLKELMHLGVTLVGHQKKIMNSVQTLRAQINGAHVSEGFLV